MRHLVIVATLLGLAGALPAAPAPLEGTSWEVTVKPDEAARAKGEKEFSDTLVFDGGKVTMTTCLKYGFLASPYTATPIEGGWAFFTRQKSEEAGKSTWTGDFKGDTVSGTMVWTKTGGFILGYSFEGRKVAR